MKAKINPIFYFPFCMLLFLWGCKMTPQTAAGEACGCVGEILEADEDGDTDREIRKKLEKCGKKSKAFREQFSVEKKQLREYKEAVEKCLQPLKEKHGLRGSAPI